jgi:spore coat protein JB
MEFENILTQLLMNDENLGENMGNKMGNKMGENMGNKMEGKMEPEMVRGAEMGDLPCEAPIAMTYTPWQRRGSRKFTAGEALDRGTLYPGLELPLFNNYNVRNVAMGPMGELQALDFAITELVLYLDTHRNDMEAFQLFKKYVAAFKDKREAYMKTIGPLMQMDAADFDRYTWTDDPWPWDYTERR